MSLSKERSIVLPVAMMPSCEIREVTTYLQEYYQTLHLLKGDESTEVVYYLMKEVNDNIHIIIPPETQLVQIKEGTYVQAVEILTEKGKKII